MAWYKEIMLDLKFQDVERLYKFSSSQTDILANNSLLFV